MPPSTMNLLAVEPGDKLTLERCDGGLKRSLTLKNPGSPTVAFKVKTTQPKSYVVRPSTGVLKSGESREVEIVFQQSAGVDMSEISSHRFLVQAIKVAEGTDTVSKDQWTAFKKEDIQEQRLNVEVQQETPQSNKKPDQLGRSQSMPDRQAASPDAGDLKVKYDELVSYTLMLEKEKTKVLDELEKLKSSRSGGGDSHQSGGFSFAASHILVALVVFLLAYAAKFVPDDYLSSSKS